MSVGDTSEGAAFIDAIAQDAAEAFDIGSRLRLPKPGDPTVPDEVVWAFTYELLSLEDPRVLDGDAPYGGMMEGGGRAYPPYVICCFLIVGRSHVVDDQTSSRV